VPRPVLIFLCLGLVLPALVSASEKEPELTPAQQKALYEANQALTKDGDPAKTRTILDDYLKRHPQEPHFLIHYLIGLSYHQEEKPGPAAQAYEAALKLRPDHRPSVLNLAAACYELERFQRAAGLWEKAFALGQDKEENLLFQAGVAYYQAKEHRQTIRVVRRLLELYPKSKKDWLSLLVQAFLETKQLEEAEEVLAQLVRRFPQEEQQWLLLAQVRLQGKRYLQAAAALEAAYALKPPKAAEWKNLADIYFYLRAPQKGVAALRKALGEKQGFEENRNLARWLIEAGRLEEALKYYDLALAQKAEVELIMEKGRALFDHGRHAEAASCFKRVVQISPEDGQAQLLLGLSALESGDLDTARRALAKAAESKNHRTQAKAALEGLIFEEE